MKICAVTNVVDKTMISRHGCVILQHYCINNGKKDILLVRFLPHCC
jgi:hypothetical protein